MQQPLGGSPKTGRTGERANGRGGDGSCGEALPYAAGPGPFVASLGAGATSGKFPIPITIVPGELALEDIKALA